MLPPAKDQLPAESTPGPSISKICAALEASAPSHPGVGVKRLVPCASSGHPPSWTPTRGPRPLSLEAWLFSAASCLSGRRGCSPQAGAATDASSRATAVKGPSGFKRSALHTGQFPSVWILQVAALPAALAPAPGPGALRSRAPPPAPGVAAAPGVCSGPGVLTSQQCIQ